MINFFIQSHFIGKIARKNSEDALLFLSTRQRLTYFFFFFLFKLFSRPREAGNLKKSAMSAAVRERTTTHTSRKIVSHGGPISGQSQSTTTANSLENNLGKSLNVPPEV